MRSGRNPTASGDWGFFLPLGAGLVLLLGGCRPAEVAREDDAPPVAREAVAFLEPDTLGSRTLAEGVQYRYAWSSRGPWSVHWIRVDLERCELGLRVVRAPSEGEDEGGRGRVSELVSDAGHGVIAGVNGDFFTEEGRPLGPERSEIGLRSARSRPALAWKPGTPPWIGTARVGGDTLLQAGPVLLLREAPGEGSGGQELAGSGAGRPSAGGEVVAGFPELLDQGRPVGDLEVSERPSFAAARHPRTAVGVSGDGKILWLVVVDGRQPQSAGMTLPELTGFLRALGADEALNLDGGGSSVLVLEGGPVSRPSDPSGERPVVNALLLVEDEELCELPAG